MENKLGISNDSGLAKAEECISKKNAVELFDTGMLDKLEAHLPILIECRRLHLTKS